MSYNVKIENNSKTFKAEWKKKKSLILYAWGLKWQEIATKIITANGIVDTGRLRASLTFITPDKESSFKAVKESKPKDRISGKAEKDYLVVGSNVVYAKKQELTNRKGAFIKPAVMEYKKDYENVTKAIMKQ